jgi:hypothetical protein
MCKKKRERGRKKKGKKEKKNEYFIFYNKRIQTPEDGLQSTRVSNLSLSPNSFGEPT